MQRLLPAAQLPEIRTVPVAEPWRMPLGCVTGPPEVMGCKNSHCGHTPVTSHVMAMWVSNGSCASRIPRVLVTIGVEYFGVCECRRMQASARVYVCACMGNLEGGGAEKHRGQSDLCSIDVKHELSGSVDGVVVAVDLERHIIPALSVHFIIHIHCCGRVPTITQPSRTHDLVSCSTL